MQGQSLSFVLGAVAVVVLRDQAGGKSRDGGPAGLALSIPGGGGFTGLRLAGLGGTGLLGLGGDYYWWLLPRKILLRLWSWG